MTHSESNSLRDALARSQAESDHPDVDLLNAFNEGTLLPRERDTLMAHLAYCAECRRVASIASDAASHEAEKAGVIAISQKPRPVFREWLPVAAAAAGIVITSAIAFRYAYRSTTGQSANAAHQSAPAIAPQATQPHLPPAPQSPANAAPAFINPAPGLANAARPHWRINSQDQLERSLAGGPWSAVLGGDGQTIRMLSVSGEQVWAGGDHSRAYRSTDNGQTWTTIVLPAKNGTDHAIAHIRFESVREIRIEAADGIAWTSSDGGATWK